MIVIGIVVVIVAAVAVLVMWQSWERQSRQTRQTVVKAVADARLADSRLREATIELNPGIEKAEAVLHEAEAVLAGDDEATLALKQALDVAHTLAAQVADNEMTVPGTVVGAAASRLRDEEQLMLVEPVLANLSSAQTATERAIWEAKLHESRTRLAEATSELDEAIASAESVRNRIDDALRVANAEREVLMRPTPSPTASPTKAERKAARAEEKKKTKRLKELAEEISALTTTSGKLETALRSAKATRQVDAPDDDPAAIDKSAATRRAAARQLRLALDAALKEHPDLPMASMTTNGLME